MWETVFTHCYPHGVELRSPWEKSLALKIIAETSKISGVTAGKFNGHAVLCAIHERIAVCLGGYSGICVVVNKSALCMQLPLRPSKPPALAVGVLGGKPAVDIGLLQRKAGVILPFRSPVPAIPSALPPDAPPCNLSISFEVTPARPEA